MPDQAAAQSVTLDANGLHYRELNARLKALVQQGVDDIHLRGVVGQRYMGTNLRQAVRLTIEGVPGNDLAAFMDGPRIIVRGNAQDGCGNTMNEGEIVVHGHAGDIVGLSARGGKIFVQEDVGYRAGVHMKGCGEKKPALVIGGTAQDFVGEYMAGGVLIMLGLTLKKGEPHRANFIGTGMHGGVIYLRGSVEDYQLGKEVGVTELEAKDRQVLEGLVNEFAAHFDCDAREILDGKFVKLFPRWLRPYGRLYTY